jgi:hypothetical protein
MKSFKFSALLLSAALFLSVGTTTVSAEGMKCGAGKCGTAMVGSPKVCNTQANCKCEVCNCAKESKVCTCEKCECGSGSKKASNTAMKCGTAMKTPVKEYERGEIKTH